MPIGHRADRRRAPSPGGPAPGRRRAAAPAPAEALREAPDDEPTVATPVRHPEPAPIPRRDETGPGTLRPKAPEPVIAARTTVGPSMTRRTVSRLRALLGLVFVVVLVARRIAGSSHGRSLWAIREDEVAAAGGQLGDVRGSRDITRTSVTVTFSDEEAENGWPRCSR